MIDIATIHGAHLALSALRGLLAAYDNGDQAALVELRREHGTFLIEDIKTRGHGRVLRLRRDVLTVSLPWWKPAPKDPTDPAGKRRLPRSVTVPVRIMQDVAHRDPRWYWAGKLTVDAPGANDPWRRQRPHGIRFGAGWKNRREQEMGWLAVALWWQRPDLMADDQRFPAAVALPLPHRRGLFQGLLNVGGHEVVMSDDKRGVPRPAQPVPESQRWDEPMTTTTSRAWGGHEVRHGRR